MRDQGKPVDPQIAVKSEQNALGAAGAKMWTHAQMLDRGFADLEGAFMGTRRLVRLDQPEVACRPT